MTVTQRRKAIMEIESCSHSSLTVTHCNYFPNCLLHDGKEWKIIALLLVFISASTLRSCKQISPLQSVRVTSTEVHRSRYHGEVTFHLWHFRFSRQQVAKRQPSGILRLTVALRISETSVNFYETTRRNIPEGCHLHFHLSVFLSLSYVSLLYPSIRIFIRNLQKQLSTETFEVHHEERKTKVKTKG
jgi:hypothetical protein